jgi:hypothetical protein
MMTSNKEAYEQGSLKSQRISHDLVAVESLLHSIYRDLLPAKEADGSFDGIDVAIQLAVQRAGQLVAGVNRSLGHIGMQDVEEWLPGPRSLLKADDKEASHD